MDFKSVASLAGYFCFYDDEHLSLVGTDSDFSIIAGYSPQEFENKFLNQMIGLIFPDDRTYFYKELRNQLAVCDLAELVFRIRHKNGRMIWVLSKIRKVIDEDTAEEYFYGVMTDFTQHKKHQDNADNLIHQYQIILSQTQNVTFELDIPNDTITFSEKWNTLFNYTPGTKNFIATLPSKAHIHPADIPLLLQILRAMQRGESYKTMDLRLSTGSKFVWFCLRATAMYDDDGKLLTGGGRVLGVTAVNDTLQSALDLAYERVNKVDFSNAFYRKDIGKRALEAMEG